jgi:regulator of sirC expression with transglutaminase-like and TPR domain
MDVTERFVELVNGPTGELPLDEAALLIAQHAHPDLDPAVARAELDRLAAEVDGRTGAAVARALFQAGGFAGNTVDYGDPRNSYLDDVLARRLGIPITLSVVMIEVGRRCGVPIVGVGMPGHFLVRATEEEAVWFDPFHGGRALDENGCREVFERVIGGTMAFTSDLLRAVDTRSILSRMLANLQNTFVQREPASLPWVVRLRLSIPGLGLEERRRLAGVLRDSGRFGEAAHELDRLAAEADGDVAERLGREAAATRARAN